MWINSIYFSFSSNLFTFVKILGSCQKPSVKFANLLLRLVIIKAEIFISKFDTYSIFLPLLFLMVYSMQKYALILLIYFLQFLAVLSLFDF